METGRRKKRGGWGRVKQNRGCTREQERGEEGERRGKQGTARGEHEAGSQALLGWSKKMGKQLGGLKTESG